MDIHISFGWWLLPFVITVGGFVAVRMFGPRMAPQNGSMFPDALGGIMELGSYLVMALFSVIAWLIWALV